jgi:hypothetical protein
VHGLAQRQLRLAQRRACSGELGSQLLERRDEPLGRRDPVGRAFAVLRGQRLGSPGGRLHELVDPAQALALVAELGLPARFETGRVVGEGAQLGQARLDRGNVARQLLVGLPGSAKVAPGGSRGAANFAEPGVGVEHAELIGGP